MKITIELDIKIDGSNVALQNLVPFKWVLLIKRKVMNLFKTWRKIEDVVAPLVSPTIVSEFEYFKREHTKYIGKEMIDGAIHLWGYSTLKDEKIYLGEVSNERWIKPEDFTLLPYRHKKRGELMYIVITKNLKKPYGFWWTYPHLYN